MSVETGKTAVVVLDRDGTIIEDRHYIKREEDVVFFPGALEALQVIRQKGYPIFLVSNQSGVGRGWIQPGEFQAVHRRFVTALNQADAPIDEIAYCFHSPDEPCPCRKPRTGLLPKTFRGKVIDWGRSYVVGDHLPDIGLAEALGATPCLVLTGKGPDTQKSPLPQSTQVFENLVDFSAKLLPASP